MNLFCWETQLVVIYQISCMTGTAAWIDDRRLFTNTHCVYILFMKAWHFKQMHLNRLAQTSYSKRMCGKGEQTDFPYILFLRCPQKKDRDRCGCFIRDITIHPLAPKLSTEVIVPKIRIQMFFIRNFYRLINNMYITL